jgi:dolichol-phosphate mannosyltransferase
MLEEVTSVQLGLHVRVRHGLRRPHNWLQLVRFACVGASGYVVNLATFAAAVHLLAVDYRVAATVAFLVAVTNNFVWNRHWTFDARDGHAGFQAVRFFAVSVVAFGFNLAALQALVAGAALAEVPAQAIAIVLATPVSFAGNKLGSFTA